MKVIDKWKIKYNQSLLSKNLKLKQKIKQLELDKYNLIKDKEELYGLINVQDIKIREQDILLRNIKEKLNKSDLFKKLMEILDK